MVRDVLTDTPETILTRPRINAISGTGAIIAKRTSQFRAIPTTGVSTGRKRETDEQGTREEERNHRESASRKDRAKRGAADREIEKEREKEKGEERRSRSLASANPISTRDVPHPPRGTEAALRR